LAGSAGGWRLVALALAFSLYAGFPETAYIDGLLAAVWTVTRFVQMPASRKGRFVGKVVTGLLGGLMLAAPVVVPFLDYLTLAFTGPHSPESVSTKVLRPSVLPQLLTPYLYGLPGSPDKAQLQGVWRAVGGYIGSAPLFCCIFALFGRKDKVIRVALALWVVMSLCKASGIWPIAQLANLLPFIEIAWFYRYFHPTLEFAVCILTAFALDDLLSAPAGKLRIFLAASLSLVAICLGPILAA